MANPERGEVALKVKDKTFTLKLSMNAAVSLQKKTGKKIGQLLNECSSLDFETIRTLVLMLLQKYHADEFKTEEQAGDLIDDAGGIAVFSDALTNLMDVNKPDPASTGDGKERPLLAQTTGTGEVSTPTPVESA